MWLRRFSVLAVVAALAAADVRAEEPEYYTLGTPDVQSLWTNSAPAYVVSNAASAASVGTFWAASIDTNEYQSAHEADAAAPVRTLGVVSAAYPVERNKPDYYLGDAIAAPADVDWDETYRAFEADATVRERFLFDAVNRVVYVTRGETSVFTWKLTSGETVNVVIVATSVSSGRPKNIFWTDDRYGGRAVDLTGKFVRFFGPEALLKVETNKVSTGTSVGGEESTQDKVTKGLYIDSSGGKKTLYAAGELEGQVVMAYYDSGTYERIVDVQTLQISRPSVEVLCGTVGSQLKPSGCGYDVTGLVASPTTTEEVGPMGAYLYQHACDNTLNPLHKAVFALRPTDKETRNQTQIYWMETDNQGVAWPFEVDEYLVAWPETMPIFVRGDKDGDVGKGLSIPASYAVSLSKYQESADGASGYHADPPENNVFTTRGAGLSLLKLTQGDNVWFVPIRSVLRSDPTWYDPVLVDVSVGRELGPMSGSVAGVAEGRVIPVDTSIPGYIYEAVSDQVWNPRLYSADGTGATGYPSVVYPVTASMDDSVTNRIEVWWSTSFARDDMPEPIVVPTLPQSYAVRWPEAIDASDIVLASQRGSAAESVYRDGQTLVFDGPDACLRLPASTYFSVQGGTLLFWTAPYESVPESQADSALVSLDATNGTHLVEVFLDQSGRRIRARIGAGKAADLAVENPNPTGWACVALSWSPASGQFTLRAGSPDGNVVNTSQAPYVAVEGLEDILTDGRLGASKDRAACSYRMIDGFTTWLREMTAEELVNLSCRPLDPDGADISCCISFDGADDLVNTGTSRREAHDLRQGVTCIVEDCLKGIPGAPRWADGILVSDVTPTVYRQTDPDVCGYNPNEEHAFVQAGAGGYVVWALRTDLNELSKVSRPGVLVEYAQDGVAKMRWYDVLLTNGEYRALSGTCVAGQQVPGPHPFDLFDTPWMPKTRWNDLQAVPPYRDRKGQVWARCAGEFDILMEYAQEDDFDWPGLKKPEVGASVPWLAYLKAPNTEPEPWHWTVTWPEEVPELRIGQTLTTPEGGLPEVWNAASMALVYPDVGATNVVLLTDPTVARVEPLGCKASDLKKIGLSTEPDGGLQNYKGKYYFIGLPPALSDRVYIDPSNDKLYVIGKKEDRTGGVNMLLVNVLTEKERAELYGLGTNVYDATISPLWEKAVMSIAREPVQPTTTTRQVNPKTGLYESVSTYLAPDHYALTAVGGTNYVTLIENDATNGFCSAGNPIQMRVLKVVPEYYTGRVVTREDELNKLSQVLGIHYTEAFAGAADDFIFDWRRKAPDADGTMPTDYDTGYKSKFSEEEGVGLTSFFVGGQGDTLANMVNTYWTCRYRAKEGSPAAAVMSTNWSAWCSPPALAEGWVQRVLNNVTPFTQRMTDLYNNAVDTSVTMLRQAGGPYEGDVALNQENLSSVGLVQLYRTIFNKAESMSLLQGIDDAGANKQLLLAAERLADLYMVLGDEAYTDALNPTIGFGSNFAEYEVGLTIDYGAASSALFCFDNQVPTLLDEELALLRGRSCVNAPGNTVSPYFNRLVWNFTKGITAGEVAYAVNYGISGAKDAEIDETTAAAQYPQGHGDAYGHYLSALQGYYRLLRNPYFSWGVPGMSEMNVADNVVNVDYYDEAKFADAAAAVAKVARKTVELTALKHWRDNGADTTGGGYLDVNDNGFGYGEWAVRGGFGALCNWAVANSLLPEEEKEDASGASYEDRGLLRIDRGTVLGLAALSDAMEAIQATCDRMDAGVNPIGLDERAIPFDLTPLGSAKDATHYEQVRTRAGAAFDNAKKVLDRAQTYANRLRLIAETEAAVTDKAALMESKYFDQLVAIYGKPYSDDIGPSGTYPQGYDGPDYYHYMWMDLAPYGLTDLADTMTVTTVTYKVAGYNSNGEIKSFSSSIPSEETGNVLSYSMSANGVILRKEGITGERPASGALQVAYADFLRAYADVQQKLMLYRRSRDYVDFQFDLAFELKDARAKLADVEDAQLDGSNGHSVSDSVKGYVDKMAAEKKSLVAMQATLDSVSMGINIVGALGGIVGLAASVGDVVKSSAFAGMAVVYGAARAITAGLEGDIANCEQKIALCENALERADRDYAGTVDRIESWSRASEAVEAEAKAVADLCSAWANLAAAQEQVSALLTQANLLRNDRELERRQYANNISKMRYNDMFFRKLSNAALSQYDTAFDLARRYAFLSAKAYGYETGSPLDSTETGAAILRKIIGARALGETKEDGTPMVSDVGDEGLAGALAKLDENWKNRKTQLGINNPQSYATWYSLRHGLFRILPDETGDAAWATELAKYWVEDIRSDAEFRRYCQPFASQFGLADKEPGLVIPFETSIDFACNLFGKPLAFDDSQLDSTYFATKIAAAGVWFAGYNEKREGYKGASAFATTPNVYLVPVGVDRMRVPGSDGEDIADFSVVDQTIPVPYPVTAAEFAEAGWLPSYLSGDLGGAEDVTRLRRHPSFRAYFGNRDDKPTDAALDAVRLTGRSVWNTRWLLIIPAGTLNADRDQALKSFIYGLDTDRDGVIDVMPVSDIKIGFKTYSQSGL